MRILAWLWNNLDKYITVALVGYGVYYQSQGRYIDAMTVWIFTITTIKLNEFLRRK